MQQKFWHRLTFILLAATVSVPFVSSEAVAKSTGQAGESDANSLGAGITAVFGMGNSVRCSLPWRDNRVVLSA